MLAACQRDVAGPETYLLVGAFGATDQRAELWANHAGIELNDFCTYFVSSEPPVLAPDRSFQVDGRYYGSGPFYDASRARLVGRITSNTLPTVVTVTLTLLDVRPPAAQPALTLTENTHYAGAPFPCPA
jgi:hypothetical protein